MRYGFFNRRFAPKDIPAHTIVSYGVEPHTVEKAPGPMAEIAGVTGEHGAPFGHVDLIFTGEAKVRAGGEIAAGDFLTSDAQGRAVTFAGEPGTKACVLGQALDAATEGDLCRVEMIWPLMQPGR